MTLASYTHALRIPFAAPDCVANWVELSNVLRAFAGESLAFSLRGNNWLRVFCAKGTADVKCSEGRVETLGREDVDVFGTPFGEVPWRDVLKTVAPFASVDSRRPISSVAFDGNSVRASDGVHAVDYWIDSPAPLPFAMPLATVQAVLPLLEIGPAKYVATDGKTILFDFGNGIAFVSRLQSAAFPDLSSVFEADRSLLCAKGDLGEALKLSRKIGGLNIKLEGLGCVQSETAAVTTTCRAVFTRVHSSVRLQPIVAVCDELCEQSDGSIYFEGPCFRGKVAGST